MLTLWAKNIVLFLLKAKCTTCRGLRRIHKLINQVLEGFHDFQMAPLCKITGNVVLVFNCKIMLTIISKFLRQKSLVVDHFLIFKKMSFKKIHL